MGYEITLATSMCISVVFALSLNLITGFCGQISLGHAAFFGVGAYTAALSSQAGLAFPLDLLAAAAAAAVFGFIVGLSIFLVVLVVTGLGFFILSILFLHCLVVAGILIFIFHLLRIGLRLGLPFCFGIL